MYGWVELICGKKLKVGKMVIGCRRSEFERVGWYKVMMIISNGVGCE